MIKPETLGGVERVFDQAVIDHPEAAVVAVVVDSAGRATRFQSEPFKRPAPADVVEFTTTLFNHRSEARK